MPMSPRIARLATAAVLQLGALVLAHQLVYLARYGSRFGEALAHSGHGDAWTAAVVSAMVLGIGIAAMGATRLIRLGVLVRGRGLAPSDGRGQGSLELAALVRAWLRLAPRMALLSLVLLTVQENAEQLSVGTAMAGPGILFSRDYAGGAWIAIGVALVVSLVVALFEWRRDALLARLRAARTSFARHARAARRPSSRLVQPVESELGRRSALRAPPAGAAA